ncbi:alcohol dehydrogenase catalytic domain-containing protein [Clostridiales bacterium BX7]|uniref:Alcohol dehydrogenase catalytic domain-containing protein n=2 Tax=Feifania hominis TaxID=2763660 RepID=A0A926DC43_9FIRM|nr:alcohol dehydrogenase catalytic domain-containing protein [Feifania hominis]
MKAAVKVDEQKRYVVTEVPIPELGPLDVLVKVHTIGLCGTDVAIRNNTFMGRHGPVKPPLIPGHEFTGEVVDVGPAVSRFKVGDKVFERRSLYCGVCRECIAGRKCTHWVHWGIDKNGGFAQYAAIHEQSLFPLPDFLPYRHAPLTENAAMAVRIATQNGIAAGSTVAIFGPGSCGQLLVQTVSMASPLRLIMVGLGDDEQRLKKSLELGATDAINADAEDPVKKIMELTDGHGADFAIEVTGKSAAVENAIHSLAVSGTCIVAGSGFEGKPVHFKPWNFVRNENVIKTIQGYNGLAYVTMLDLYKSGKLDFDSVITRYMPLDQVNEACDLVEAKQAVKIMLNP